MTATNEDFPQGRYLVDPGARIPRGLEAIEVRLAYTEKALDEVRKDVREMRDTQLAGETKRDNARIVDATERDSARRTFWMQAILGPLVVAGATVWVNFTIAHSHP